MIEKIVIYGTGGTAGFYYENDLDRDRMKVVAFCDGNSEKWGMMFMGLPVLSPGQLLEIDFDVIIVASVFFEEIKKTLLSEYHLPENKVATIHYGQMDNIRKRYNSFYDIRGMKKKDNRHITIKDKERIVIYTAITGNYDDLRDPVYVDERCDYICYTDNPDIKSNIWEIRVLPKGNKDDNRNAKQVKVLPHKFLSEYDWSIWVDAALEITGDLCRALDTYAMNSNFLSFMHYRRGSVYEEAEIVKKARFDEIDTIEKQMQKYRMEGFDDHNELIAGGVLFRKHNQEDVIKVMEHWWNEIITYSKRDQLSFNYCAWKEHFTFDLIDENIYENDLVKPYPHNRKKA